MNDTRVSIKRSELMLLLVGVCLLSLIIGISLFVLVSDAVAGSAVNDGTSLFDRLFRPASIGTDLRSVPTSSESGLPPFASTTTGNSPNPSGTTTLPVGPGVFRGPSGPPHIIGPRSNPPNY